MPRKSEITKSMIIEAGVAIIKASGYAQLSTRNIAKHLDCSTQPIYYYFKNIESVDEDIIQRVYQIMIKDYMQKDAGEDKFLQMGLGYIEFAQKDSNLFEYLYFSRRNKGINEKDYGELMKTMKQGEKMDEIEDELLKRIHEKISLFVHGLAMTLMNQPELYTMEEVRALIVDTTQGIADWEKGQNV